MRKGLKRCKKVGAKYSTFLGLPFKKLKPNYLAPPFLKVEGLLY